MIGLLVVLAEPSLNIALIGALAIVLLLPLVVRIIRGRFDLFDPFTVAAIALFVMFVLRPAALLIDGQTFYNGYSIEATFKEALFVALLGCVAFVVGYQTPIGSRLAGRLGPIAPRGLQIGSVAIYAIGIFCLGVSLYALFILQSGGINALASFLVGRLPEHNDLFISSTGYLYQGLLLSVPASLLLFATGTIQGTTRLQVVGLLLMIPLLVLASTTGGRLQLLTLVSGPIVFLYLYRQRRPQALKVIFLLLIALPVLLGALRDARVAEQREQNRGEVLQEAVLHPDRQWGELILGADTEMFDTLATELSVVPEYLSFQHGAVFSDVGVRAVPRPIWPNKPLESNDLMIDTLWPEHYSQSRASSASSIIGSLYLDSGPLSVAVGMALLGVVVKILATWAATWRTDAAAQMVAALSIPLLVVLLRGTLPHTLSILAFTMVPLIVGLLFTRIGAEKPSPAESALTYRPGWRAS